MSISLKNATDFRHQLETNLKIHSAKNSENLHRLRRKVAFDRLLARIFTAESAPFFLKGGYAMELRIAHARATKDMDLTCFKRMNDSKEPQSHLILQELQHLARIDINDYFSFQIGQPQSDIENAPYGGSRHSVVAVIDNRPFVEFHLDVGGDFLIDHVEKVSGINWLSFCDIPAPVISMISIEQQFAEKLHSYTLPREQINTRAKDLIDMILLLNLDNRPPEVFRHALYRVFKARNTHALPITLAQPPHIWEKSFEEMARECGLFPNLEAGFNNVAGFYISLLSTS